MFASTIMKTRNIIQSMSTLLSPTWIGACLLAAVLLLISPSARAELVTFQFTAEVTRSINNSMAVGDAFTCQYTFDTATPDDLPNDTRAGHYLDALTAVTLATGSSTHSLTGPLNRIFVHDNYGSRHDEYRVRAALSEGRSINLVLTDPGEQAISSEALSTTPPDLAAWATENVVVSWTGDNGGTATLEGVVTAFELVVPDTTPPTITLNGSSVVHVECGIETYSEAGAVGADDVDGAVAVTIGGDTVNSGALGTYVVTYDAVDEAGNPAQQVTRTVIVRDTTAPGINPSAGNLVVECDGQGNAADYSAWISSNGGAAATDHCSAVNWTYKVVASKAFCGSTGSQTVRFTATDASGNRSHTWAVFRTVDTTAPDLSWSVGGSPATGSSIKVKGSDLPVTVAVGVFDVCDRLPSLSLSWVATYTGVNGDVTDVTANTSVAVDRIANAVTLSRVPKSYTAVTITAVGTDACGNVATESLTITVDNSTTPTAWGESTTPPGNGKAKGRRR